MWKLPSHLKRAAGGFFLTGFFSSVSRPADPHRACCPGCKRSRTRSYGAETNSWQQGEPLGSRVRCQSHRAGKECLPERLSAGGRWMRWEFHFITAAIQSKTLHFVLTGKSSMWTPKPAALYQILTIWGLNINLNLKHGESLMVLAEVFYDTYHHFWHFCTKVRALHIPELNSNIKGSFKQSHLTWQEVLSPVVGWDWWIYFPSQSFFWNVDSTSWCILTLFTCCTWVHVDKGHWNDSQMEDAHRGRIRVWWNSPVRSFIWAQSDQLNEIVCSPACRNRNCDRLFPWLFHLRLSRARSRRHSSDLKV